MTDPTPRHHHEPAPLAATPGARRRLLPPAGNVLLVALGGAAGAVLRTAQSAAFPPAAGAFPASTLAENLTGAFLLGLLLTLATERWVAPTWVRPAFGTGLLGAYTTYATVGLELHLLALDGAIATAALYLWGTALLGLACAAGGVAVARALPSRRQGRP